MSRPEAYPITYGILGLLAFHGPLSGYDIKRLFDHALAPMWGAAHSQIYKELRRMKELGWVDMEREEQESRPDRKVYSITSEGQAALVEWQKQPPQVLQLRDELLLKILLGSFASREALTTNIQDGIRFHESRLQEYRQMLHHLPVKHQRFQASGRPNPYASPDEEDPYFGLITRFAISLEKTYIQWLYETLSFIQSDEPLAEEE